jgi:dipeptidyl aminopeptidase/acylaminoacyl peptidase
LASQGIVTLVVDPRGSDGYGAAFAHGLFHDAAGKQSEDLAAAARFLASRGYADAKRIALYGHSYAGFLTLSTMEQYPNLFGAGVLQAGVFDWPSFIPLEVPYALIRFGTPELYQSRGRPALHLDRLKSPVLVAHGSGDFNAGYNNSELLVNELMKANKDFEFITYPNERHGWERAETDRDFLRRVTRFLERTLAGNR